MRPVAYNCPWILSPPEHHENQNDRLPEIRFILADLFTPTEEVPEILRTGYIKVQTHNVRAIGTIGPDEHGDSSGRYETEILTRPTLWVRDVSELDRHDISAITVSILDNWLTPDDMVVMGFVRIATSDLLTHMIGARPIYMSVTVDKATWARHYGAFGIIMSYVWRVQNDGICDAAYVIRIKYTRTCALNAEISRENLIERVCRAGSAWSDGCRYVRQEHKDIVPQIGYKKYCDIYDMYAARVFALIVFHCDQLLTIRDEFIALGRLLTITS